MPCCPYGWTQGSHELSLVYNLLLFLHVVNLFKFVITSDFRADTYLKLLQVYMFLVLCGIVNTRTLLNNAIQESLQFSEVA